MILFTPIKWVDLQNSGKEPVGCLLEFSVNEATSKSYNVKLAPWANPLAFYGEYTIRYRCDMDNSRQAPL